MWVRGMEPRTHGTAWTVLCDVLESAELIIGNLRTRRHCLQRRLSEIDDHDVTPLLRVNDCVYHRRRGHTP